MRGESPWPTVATEHLERIISEAARAGADPERLRRDAKILSYDAGGRAPARALFDLWELAVEQSGDPALPIALARRTSLDEFGLLGFTVMTSPSMATALECGVNYYGLLSDSGYWTVSEEGRRVIARWTRPGAQTRGMRISNESVLAHFVAGCRALAGHDVRPELVRFRHSAPASYRALLDYFDTRVEFGAGEDALVFAREEMDRRPLLANAALNGFLRSVADELIEPIRVQSFAERVRQQIRETMPTGIPGMHEVARALGTTRRTLHRKLAAENTSFRALVEEIRRDEASIRLGRSEPSLTALALDLGFSDLSTFSRAHRRWFGVAPSRARK